MHRETRRVVDGMHRLQAARLQGEKVIPVRYLDGPASEVFIHSVAANVAHGLPPDPEGQEGRGPADPGLAPGLCRIARWRGSPGCRPRPSAPSGALRVRNFLQSQARVGADGRSRPLDAAERRKAARAFPRRAPRRHAPARSPRARGCRSAPRARSGSGCGAAGRMPRRPARAPPAEPARIPARAPGTGPAKAPGTASGTGAGRPAPGRRPAPGEGECGRPQRIETLAKDPSPAVHRVRTRPAALAERTRPPTWRRDGS